VGKSQKAGSSSSKSYQFRVRVPSRVIARRNLPSFGESFAEDHENVTTVSKDPIPMEHPDDQFTEEPEDPTLMNTLVSFLSKQQERSQSRGAGTGFGDDEANAEEADEASVKSGGEGKGATDRYVPPSLRRGGAGASAGGPRSGKDIFDQEQNAIRVSNLTKAVCENDIYDLFEPFGKIIRVSLPRNPETNEPKGFAFVTYLDRQSAVEAMNRYLPCTDVYVLLYVSFLILWLMTTDSRTTVTTI
jgi:hypothetical protein